MKWIILDAMGVVYKTGGDVNYLLIPFLKSKNKNIDSQIVQELYVKTSLGKYSSKEFWMMLGFANEYPEIEQYYLDTFPEVDTDIFNFFSSIDKSVYNTAMLSNDVSEWSTMLRKRFNLEHLFSKFIISGDVKARKPSKEIFEITLSQLQTPSANCIFVDERPKNLQTASDLGFRTVFFDRDGIGSDAVLNLKYVHHYITSFAELTPIINEFKAAIAP